MLSDILTDEFSCGPLRLLLHSDDVGIRKLCTGALELYTCVWPYRHYEVDIWAGRQSSVPPPAAAGNYLRCARMTVDAVRDGLYASTKSGIYATGALHAPSHCWNLQVPHVELSEPARGDIEDIVGLALTTAWREQGWIPLHAAALAKQNRCILLCASSGGGKSTLTAALVRRGWRALGDDKLLIAASSGLPVVRALLQTFNLHPQTREWFPEFGDLSRFPTYSAWTDKRRVPLASLCPQGVIESANPTHIALLDRRDALKGIRIRQLSDSEIIPLLLRQTVIPKEPRVGRQILQTLAALGRTLRGLHIEIGRDAYRDPACVEAVDAAIA